MNNDFLFEKYNNLIKTYLNNNLSDSDEVFLIDRILQNKYLQGRLDKNLLKNISNIHNFSFNPQNEIIGFAEFPVVDNSNSFICGIKIEEETNANNKIDNRIKNKQNLDEVATYLYKLINKNLINNKTNNKDLFILNFKKKFIINEHLFEPNIYDNLQITGSSFLFAAAAAFISNVFDLPINANYIFTGAFNKNGEAIEVSSIDKKFEIIKTERPNTQKIFIPPISLIKNTNTLNIIRSNNSLFEEVKDIETLIIKVFDKTIEEICKVDTEIFESTYQYVRCSFFPEQSVTLTKNNYNDVKLNNQNIELWNFVGNEFDIFPVDFGFKDVTKNMPDFIIFNGKVANIYTGNILAHSYKQCKVYFCTKEGKDGGFRIFARPQGSDEYIGYYINSPELNK
jgi:hypothetical protein